MDGWILTLVIFAPLVGAVLLAFVPREAHTLIRRAALGVSTLVLALTIVAAVMYYHEGRPAEAGESRLLARQEPRPPDEGQHAAAGVASRSQPGAGFRLVESAAWLGTDEPAHEGKIDIKYAVGIDGISLWLLLLTAFLMPLSIWGSFSAIQHRVREYYALMLLLQTGMMGVFCALDLLLFYVFFEFTLVPLFFLIGIWGGPERQRAANKFFIYTVAGSVLTFAGVLYIAYYAYTHGGRHEFTLDIRKLMDLARQGQIDPNVQWWLFAAFAAGFAIKVPLFPVHTWLPLAHTEAPTAGSVILAGVLLKLGTYGFCRLSLPLLPEAVVAWAPFMAVLAIIGIIYAALAAWVQDDVKKLVAYSSVSHLGFCMLGMFSLKAAGLDGAVLYMVNHGLSTGALFLVIGMIYERYHTRDIHALGGLARRMPWMAFFLIVFTLSSIGLPGLNGFVGEFLVLLGTATSAFVGHDGLGRDGLAPGPLGWGYAVPAALGIILGAVYMLWMCQRVLFGPLIEPEHTPDTSRGLTVDLTRREIGILAPIALACLVIGVYPKPMLQEIDSAAVANILQAQPTPLAGDTRVASLSAREAGDGVKPRASPLVHRRQVLEERFARVCIVPQLPSCGTMQTQASLRDSSPGERP